MDAQQEVRRTLPKRGRTARDFFSSQSETKAWTHSQGFEFSVFRLAGETKAWTVLDTQPRISRIHIRTFLEGFALNVSFLF